MKKVENNPKGYLKRSDLVKKGEITDKTAQRPPKYLGKKKVIDCPVGEGFYIDLSEVFEDR